MCLSCGPARRLVELRAKHVLIAAALDGLITEVTCAMPQCLCPEGRAHFTSAQRPWGISADRWPVPGREGGEYTPGNVRVAHYACNSAETTFKPGHQPNEAAKAGAGAFLRRMNKDPEFLRKKHKPRSVEARANIAAGVRRSWERRAKPAQAANGRFASAERG